MNSVIFDIDGTLWDATRSIMNAWNDVFERKGLPLVTLEETRNSMGKTEQEICEYVLPDIPFDVKWEAFRDAFPNEIPFIQKQGGVLFDHVTETIESLSKSYALCILTNAGSRYANAFLDASGLRRYFTDFIGYDDNHLTKDKNIILLREKHGFDKVIYVGDTLADQRFAEAVPVPFICHEKGFGQCENPEYVFDDYRNLEPMVRMIFAD